MDFGRLIVDGKCRAEFNMAADAYLVKWVEDNPETPVLRVYGWEQPSITIGYHQRLERAVDRSRLAGTPVVRRLTGGRALYHDDGEITYAVAVNHRQNPELGRTLHESYRLIAGILVRFYRTLNWPAEISTRPDPAGREAGGRLQKGCFASVSRYEIVAFGRKIAASAQRRTNTAFLQHGAVRLSGPLVHPAIIGPTEEKGSDLPGIGKARAELISDFVESFAEKLKIDFRKSPFNSSELAEIFALAEPFKISPGPKI